MRPDDEEALILDQERENEDEDDDWNDEKREGERRVRVFDRFSVILQIFAKRARTKMAKLQVFCSPFKQT